MVRPAEVPTRDLFLTTNGVAARLAIRELKRAKINPEPLLAKAGISLLKLGEEPKRIAAESQIRFLDIAAEALDDSNFTRDEGGPFEVGNQVLISSHRKLLSSKAMVVNVAEKPERDFGRYD
jgi:hypothetical protein